MRAINKNKGEKMSSMGQVDITKALTRQRGTNQGGGKGNFTCHTRRILVMRLKEFSLLRLCCAAAVGLKDEPKKSAYEPQTSFKFCFDRHTQRGGGGRSKGGGEVEKV